MIQERHHALVKPTHKGTENKSDADRTFHTLRVMMNFARTEYEVNGKSILEVNPIRDALHWRWHGTNVRTGVIPDHKLAEFYNAVMAQPNKSARDFIFLLLFTSLRRNEVSSLKWSCIDFRQGTLTIPAGYNKSKRDHVLPMTEMVRAILESRKALKLESEFVLPANEDTNYKTGHLCEPRAVLLRIRKQIGIEWIWHDLRRTALSACELQLQIARNCIAGPGFSVFRQNNQAIPKKLTRPAASEFRFDNGPILFIRLTEHVTPDFRNHQIGQL